MKLFLTFLILAATTSVTANAQSLDKQAFLELLQSVPSAEDFNKAYDILKRRDPAQEHRFEEAERRIANAKTNIPKIEALVKINTSIFDYPGLISHGTIDYFGATVSGIPIFGSPVTIPFYTFTLSPSIGHRFIVTFDEHGMITDVRTTDKR